MEREKRQKLMKLFYDSVCHPLTETKGEDYTQKTDDANSNFKRLAERMKERGMDKYDVLWVYMSKHMDAIDSWFIHRNVESEPIGMRLADAINYLEIMMTMLIEDHINPFPPNHPLGQMLGAQLDACTVEELDNAMARLHHGGDGQE